VVEAPTGAGTIVVVVDGAVEVVVSGAVVVETGGVVVGVGLAVVVVEGCGADVVVVVAAPAPVPDRARTGTTALAASANVSLPRKVSVSPISTLSDRPAEPTTVPIITPNVGDGGPISAGNRRRHHRDGIALETPKGPK
jgi:hypothetical protein